MKEFSINLSCTFCKLKPHTHLSLTPAKMKMTLMHCKQELILCKIYIIEAHLKLFYNIDRVKLCRYIEVSLSKAYKFTIHRLNCEAIAINEVVFGKNYAVFCN
jgi:hypothetical protein